MQRDRRRSRRRRRGDRKARRKGGPLRESQAQRGLLGSEARIAAVRPTGDAAGTVATRSAGIVEFSARLSGRRPEEMPGAPTLPALTETTRCSIIETDDVVGGRREILGEILALSEDDLGSALETLLRSLTVSAALSEAILEIRAARVAPVRPASLETLQALSLDVRAAGFPVRFAPTWTPLEEGEIGLGIAGAERELRDFLAGHPSYRLAWGAVGSRAASGVLSRDMRPRHFSEE